MHVPAWSQARKADAWSRAALLQRACALLAPRTARRALRVAWGAWSRVLILRLSAQREAEATRAAQATRANTMRLIM